MRLIDLDKLDSIKIHAVYEAIAYTVGKGISPPTLILCYPKKPYVCIGIHQILEKEINVEYCRENNIPIVRRQIGGGAVYLDSGQQFYHLVLPSEKYPPDVEKLYRKYLMGVVYAYNYFGLPAQYKPLNDVIINGRKASGNGAATLHGSDVIVGNIILDLDYENLTRVLRVPSEKFRDKLAKSLREWLTCIKRELGYIPPREEAKKALIEGFKRVVGPLNESTLIEEEEEKLEEIAQRMSSKEWLYSRSLKHQKLLKSLEEKCTKIMGDTYLTEAILKREKLIRVIIELKENTIKDIMIGGDFFIEPPETLTEIEENLTGKPLNEVPQIVKNITGNVNLSGITPQDIIDAINKAANQCNQ